ncbi:MAG: EamA family transporter, partial [Candidatus Micrarchaeota archaeon]
VYAIVTMMFFSFANVALKQLLTDDFMSLVQREFNRAIAPTIALFVLAGVAGYFLFISKLGLPQGTLLLILIFLVLSAMGFACLMLAVNSGKIAPVTAVVSTSTLMVAAISIFFLREELNVKELAGIAMAFGGIVLLAFSK